MDLIKRAYEDDSGNEPSDYFGLDSDGSDTELQPIVERELEYLRSKIVLQENANVLSFHQYGPDNADSQPLKIKSVETNLHNLHAETYRDSLELVQVKNKSSTNEAKEQTLKSAACWNTVLKPVIGKSVNNFAPNRCLFKIKLSEKALSSVQWNDTFCHLILSASLSGSVHVCDFLGRSQLGSFPLHSKGSREAIWSLDGRQVFSVGYDCKACLFDLTIGREVFTCTQEKPITSCQVHPTQEKVYLTGSFDQICAWDVRSPSCLPIRTFTANCKQVLCLAFLPNAQEFVCSTEMVSRDSADRNIMAWDFASGALLSNQIYQERFVCPWICVDPCGNKFFAQSSGDYIAEFSATRPYKMNKYRRYEGHKTEGYHVGCCLNGDSSLLATGDVDGSVFVYHMGSARTVRKLKNNQSPVISLDWRQGPALAATTWDGQLQFWT